MEWQKSPSYLLHQMLSLFSAINLLYLLKINIFGRDYSNLSNLLKGINLQYLCKVYCRELGQYMMLFDALEKKCNETANYSRVVTNGHQYTNTIVDGKFIC